MPIEMRPGHTEDHGKGEEVTTFNLSQSIFTPRKQFPLVLSASWGWRAFRLQRSCSSAAAWTDLSPPNLKWTTAPLAFNLFRWASKMTRETKTAVNRLASRPMVSVTAKALHRPGTEDEQKGRRDDGGDVRINDGGPRRWAKP